MDSVSVAAIAAITAPEKRCGKSTLLSLFQRLACRALVSSNITGPALFRVIEAWKPTLLIDEADAFMRDNEELRGLLNCGHTRDSAYVVRTVGDDHTPKLFFVFGAKAIAGIGRLADTLMDRSIELKLRRKRPHEQVDKLRDAEAGMFEALQAKLARWAHDNADAVRRARPALPDTLHDRAADNWEALLQIAEVAGGPWPDLGRMAAITLSGAPEDSQSAGAELLADIQALFETQSAQRISTANLVLALVSDDEKPWATWRGGKPMTPRSLSKILSEYGIRSKSLRNGHEVSKGFERDQFNDAFERYLHMPLATSAFAVTGPWPNTAAVSCVTGLDSVSDTQTCSVTPEPSLDKARNDVTGKAGEVGRADGSVTTTFLD
jgi:putative DNA primase/helicase